MSIKALLPALLLVPLLAKECVVNINIDAKDGSSTTINIKNKKQCIVNLTIDEKGNVTLDKNVTFISKDTITNIITLAKSKIGSKYESKKAGPDTFDCSGFVYYIFKENNIQLPRTSRNQSKVEGKELTKEELQIGDLVFFDTSNKGHVNHSGIYLGNGEFIHSSSGKAYGVTISNLISGWYKDKFLWGKRKNK
ncbi:MAG: C40 family peptidase [Campylobacterales bacterium]|nr:C40 family peptidase [Campylobacterales bacterium]